MIEKLSNKIVAIGGAVALVGSLVAYLGFNIESPTQTLDKHIMQEHKVHTSIEQKIDSTAKSVEHVEHIEELLEAMLRGECLENPRENLARQGLLKKCEELGINR